MKVITKIYSGTHWLIERLADIMLIGMVLLVFVQVVLRKFFSLGIPWSEEVSLLLMNYFGFIAIAIGVKDKLHIGIEIFTKKLPESVKNIIDTCCYLLITVFSVFMIIYGFQLVKNGALSTLPATKLPTSIKYGSLIIGGGLIFFNGLIHTLHLGKYFDINTSSS